MNLSKVLRFVCVACVLMFTAFSAKADTFTINHFTLSFESNGFPFSTGFSISEGQTPDLTYGSQDSYKLSFDDQPSATGYTLFDSMLPSRLTLYITQGGTTTSILAYFTGTLYQGNSMFNAGTYSAPFAGVTLTFADGSNVAYLVSNTVLKIDQTSFEPVRSLPAIPSAQTPEPTSLTLLATGLVGLAGAVRRRSASMSA